MLMLSRGAATWIPGFGFRKHHHKTPGRNGGVPRRHRAAQVAGACAGAIVRASVAEQNLPGLSWRSVSMVTLCGRRVWLCDLEASVPSPNHGSGSERTVLTSAAAGLPLENGRLKIDDKIETVLSFPKTGGQTLRNS